MARVVFPDIFQDTSVYLQSLCHSYELQFEPKDKIGTRLSVSAKIYEQIGATYNNPHQDFNAGSPILYYKETLSESSG